MRNILVLVQEDKYALREGGVLNSSFILNNQLTFHPSGDRMRVSTGYSK